MQIRTTDVNRTQKTFNRLDFFISTPPPPHPHSLMILPPRRWLRTFTSHGSQVCRRGGSHGLAGGELAHAFAHTQARVPCPSRALGERAGLLADIATADRRIHAKPLTTTLSKETLSLAPVPSQPAFYLDRRRSTAII